MVNGLTTGDHTQDMNCTNHKLVLDTTCMLTVEERVEKGNE